MSDLEHLGDEPVSNYRRSAPEQPSPVVQFFTTAAAVWIGAMLAGICLFFMGRAWLKYELQEAAEKAKVGFEEGMKKLERDQKKFDEDLRKRIGEK
jgi:membrane protein DedA with SNARE-associated domain